MILPPWKSQVSNLICTGYISTAKTEISPEKGEKKKTIESIRLLKPWCMYLGRSYIQSDPRTRNIRRLRILKTPLVFVFLCIRTNNQ